MLKRAVIARNLHKWLGLFVGLQVFIWLASGLYMVVVDIDFIHGDPLVRNTQQAVNIPASRRLSISDLKTRYPEATRISLQTVMGETFYLVSTPQERYLFDPRDGQLVSPLAEDAAKDIAVYHFNGTAPVIRASLIESDPPMEIQTRHLPLWRIDFDDRYSSSFYIDPYSGVLVTRRHQYWRIFDFMWMLHIMDYRERADAHNTLLKVVQIAGLIFAISGLWLLLYSFRRRQEKERSDKGTSSP